MNGWTDGWMNRWKEGCTDGWKNERMDGGLDGRMGWMDLWFHEKPVKNM